MGVFLTVGVIFSLFYFSSGWLRIQVGLLRTEQVCEMRIVVGYEYRCIGGELAVGFRKTNQIDALSKLGGLK